MQQRGYRNRTSIHPRIRPSDAEDQRQPQAPELRHCRGRRLPLPAVTWYPADASAVTHVAVAAIVFPPAVLAFIILIVRGTPANRPGVA